MTAGSRTARIGVACCLLAVGACAPARPSMSVEELDARREQLLVEHETIESRLIDRAVRRIAEEPDPTFDVLILSGGGARGAFGAGVLNGWGELPANDPMSRPDFEVVTGISTGALLASFVLAEQTEQAETVYRSIDKGWIRPTISTRSILSVASLREAIRQNVDMELIEELAESGRRGRGAIVAATSLDLATYRIWDLTDEAIAATEQGSPDRIHDILLAAAAVPGLFPPVEIDGLLYADAAVIQNVFALSADAEFVEHFTSAWFDANPDRPLPRIRYWLVINGKMDIPPTTVQPKVTHVVKRSLETSLRFGNVTPLHEIYQTCQWLRAQGFDAEFRWIAIPRDFEIPAASHGFDSKATGSLADLGRAFGLQPDVWNTTPPER